MVERCLVCGKCTRYSYLGVLICRACKIFYRRKGNRKRRLRCASRKGSCDKSPRCKKCRFKQIDKLVRGASTREDAESERESSEEPHPSTKENAASPKIRAIVPFEQAAYLERVRIGYRAMSLSRRAAELIELHPSSHPTCAFHNSHSPECLPLVPATITSLNFALRLLVSALFDFAVRVFDGFASLSVQNKWYLIKNFYWPFWTLESAYRIISQFPHLRNTQLMSFTTYLDETNAEEFMNIPPRTQTAKEDARDLLRCFLRYDTRLANNAMRSAQISEDEYHALLVLAFWSIENTSSDESLIDLGVRYRAKAVGELQQSYRKKGTEEECAKRIGHLMDIVVALQELSYMMPMNLEMFSLLNVFDDNTTMYQMTKKGVPGLSEEKEEIPAVPI